LHGSSHGSNYRNSSAKITMAEKIRIVFFGTAEFAVPSLHILLENKYDVAAIVTAPDKPAGRGLELKHSPVKEYALKRNMRVLQPENLKSEDFFNQIKALQPNVGVVVAFRKLPKDIWSFPSYGTFNLHASLLPHYRGAAPINWAIMNGEKESGVTTFFLNEEIDRGNIIFRAKEIIHEHDTAQTVYDRLMKDGADLTLKTVRAIESGNYTLHDQTNFVLPDETIRPAPKIFKQDCKINWNKTVAEVYDFIRGLSPYPAAWAELLHEQEQEKILLKIFKSKKEMVQHSFSIASIHTDHKSYAKIAVKEGFIHLHELQLAGKRKMGIEEFLRGFSFVNYKIHL
jgi:methionyl-tRNA formyltransferase